MSTIVGTDRDDTLRGTERADHISGLGGDDLVFGRGGADYVLVGDGNNRAYGGRGDDTLFGSSGHDTLIGGGGDDIINPGDPSSTPIADSIEGGAGDDGLYCGNGDTALGGAGNDTIRGAGGEGGLFDGGDGHNFLEFFRFTSDTPLVGDFYFPSHEGDTVLDGAVVRGFQAGQITLGDGDDVVKVARAGPGFTLFGGNGDDQLTGSAGRDSLYGDTVLGGGGDDLLGSDSATPGAQLSGGAGADTLSGPGQDAILKGGGGDDFLHGDDRTLHINMKQRLVGGGGDDTLSGGGGADILEGGAGRDVYQYTSLADSRAAAPDLIRDPDFGVVDLSRLTAHHSGHFVIVGAFDGGAKELTITYSQTDGLTHVEGDTNGDKQADFAILIEGDHTDHNNYVL